MQGLHTTHEHMVSRKTRWEYWFGEEIPVLTGQSIGKTNQLMQMPKNSSQKLSPVIKKQGISDHLVSSK